MVSLLKLPQDIKESVRTSDTIPKSLLLLLLRQSNKINVREFYRQIKEGNLTVREAKTELTKSKDKKEGLNTTNTNLNLLKMNLY